ncbi:MAG: DUF309 domain-containing protein [Bacteroidota bacterium]
MKTTKMPAKKKPDQIDRSSIKELELTMDDWNDLERGVKLFNAGNYWHAHEAWEDVWKRREEDERLFFQGIIQLAAAYHHVTTHTSYRGAINNLDKSKLKLEIFEPRFLGIEIQPLLESIRQTKEDLEDVGQKEFAVSDSYWLPKIQFHKPKNLDLSIELSIILEAPEFYEGVKLFNNGYYWEAHETWEAFWHEHTGDARNMVQAFSQMAEAYSFTKLNKPSTAKYLFEKAIGHLATYESNIPDINIGSLISMMGEVLHLIERQTGGRPAGLPSDLKPVIKITGREE